MKKSLCTIFVFAVFLGLTVFCAPQVSAVSPVIPSPSVSPVPTATPMPIEYVLPYPGLLPTHPLYFIKNIRDAVIEFLITDTVSKADFYILQADKKLNMGVVLLGAKKTKDADSAFSDAMTSRTRAITLLETYRKAGSTVPGYLIEKLFLSMDKHTEVLRDAGRKTDAVVALRVRAERSLNQAP